MRVWRGNLVPDLGNLSPIWIIWHYKSHTKPLKYIYIDTNCGYRDIHSWLWIGVFFRFTVHCFWASGRQGRSVGNPINKKPDKPTQIFRSSSSHSLSTAAYFIWLWVSLLCWDLNWVDIWFLSHFPCFCLDNCRLSHLLVTNIILIFLDENLTYET